jgi:phenylpropionate dioxygenase-like ring-hydroxylating dioxygenase large terminal subunit
MLSKEENELITHTGPGTPMGEVFRRFWLPAVLSHELEADGSPLRLKLLGEEMVAFRNTGGQVGVLERQCPHRLADMWFGRNEDSGLACAYHGWKFDIAGNCIEMPTETAESGFKHKVKMRSYQAREFGGVIWVYMGPTEHMPELPQFEWARVPASHRLLMRWVQESNYLQAAEGEIDSAHISFNHRSFLKDPKVKQTRGIPLAAGDGAPRLTVKETDYGFIYGSRRTLGPDEFYWRCTQFMMPMYSLIPNPGWPAGGRGWVPIDDEHISVLQYSYNPDAPLTEQQIAARASSPSLHPVAPFKLPDGSIIDIGRPVRNKDNDYLIDREMQKTVNYTGIGSVREQDMAMTDGMKPVVQRWREHLGTTDVAIIASRRILLRLARDLQEGKEPFMAYHGDLYHVRPVDVTSHEGEFDRLFASEGQRAVARV